MPAFEEEIEAAIREGVKLKTLASPVKIKVKDGHVSGMTLQKNELGNIETDGRRKPVPISKSEYTVSLDTLIAAISEEHETDALTQIKIGPRGTVYVDMETLSTDKAGIFAGGDLIRGPGTVINAIADGKKAAIMIDRYLCNKKLKQPHTVKLPQVYIKPVDISDTERENSRRVEMPVAKAKPMQNNFEEVELTLSNKNAICEAKRCLRCDLEFTQSLEDNGNGK